VVCAETFDAGRRHGPHGSAADELPDEQVYLYHINASEDFIRKVFLDYLQKVNSLKDRPEWYNALTGNCMTGIRNIF